MGIWDMITGNVDPNTVRNSQLQGMNLGAYTQRGDKYTSIGDEFLDIDSDRNQAMKQNLLKMSMDAAAQQNMQSQRNMAMGGYGVPNAMQNAAGTANANRMQNQGQQNFMQAFQQNQGQAANYYGMGNQQYDTRSGYQNQANTAATGQMQQNAANTAGMIQGIGGMAMNMVAPGMGGMLGFGMNALGGGSPTAGGPQNMWQAGARPYQWTPPPVTGTAGVGTGSDIRLKENIELVGQSDTGINIYDFDYKNEEGRYRGVMAQEVPEASTMYNGYLTVDYDKIDVNFERLE